MIIVLILSSTRPLRHRYVWVRCRGHCRLHLVKRRPVPRHRITCWADHLSCSLRARPCRWAAVRPVRTAATAQHRRWQLQLSMTLQRWRHRPRRPPSKCRLWWQQHLRRRKLALLPWCWPWRGTGAVPGPRSRRNADLEEVDPEVALPPAYPDSGANQQLWTKVMNFFLAPQVNKLPWRWQLSVLAVHSLHRSDLIKFRRTTPTPSYGRLLASLLGSNQVTCQAGRGSIALIFTGGPTFFLSRP